MDPSCSSPEPATAPAAVPPSWDAPLGDVPLCFLDLEMTGLDPTRDRIIEICIERVVRGELEARLCSLVRAPVHGAEGVHGISVDELRTAPTFAELAAPIVELVGDAVVVAHRAPHDLAFLAAEFALLGTPWPCPPAVDTLAVARRVLELPRHGLGAIAAELGIEHAGAHRAAGDVCVLRALWARLLALVSPATLGELVRAQAPGRASLSQILALAEQAMALGRPLLVDYRRSGRPRQRLALCVTAVRTDLDPPWVLGYLQHARGRRELRGDRIVAAELADVG